MDILVTFRSLFELSRILERFFRVFFLSQILEHKSGIYSSLFDIIAIKYWILQFAEFPHDSRGSSSWNK